MHIEMEDCEYYTYQHEPEKYWKDTSYEMTEEDLAFLDIPSGEKYGVKLACDTTKDIDMRLSGIGTYYDGGDF